MRLERHDDMTGRIHLSKAQLTQLEEDLVVEAVRSGWIAPLGPMVDRFESDVAERVGVAHALALSSGTAALHLALLHLGAGPGTAVVVASMTFAATANAVVYTGAEPVFVDSQASDGNVDGELLIEAVRNLQDQGLTVVAAVPVDLFGRCCDYDLIAPGLEALGVPLLEDAAESLGATWQGRAAGSFGTAAAVSFNGNKIITTSGGGMLLSDDAELISHARKLSTQAREPVPWYEHTEIGYNYRLSNILAAVGIGQLARLDELMERRREIRTTYAVGLADLSGIRLLGPPDAQGDNAWLTCIVVEPEVCDASALIAHLNDQDIEARHLWKPMHLQPVFAGARSFVTGTSERLFARGVALPSGSGLTDAEIDRVLGAIHDGVRIHA